MPGGDSDFYVSRACLRLALRKETPLAKKKTKEKKSSNGATIGFEEKLRVYRVGGRTCP